MTAENEQFFREKINGVREYLAFVKQAYVDEEGNIEMLEYGVFGRYGARAEGGNRR